MKVSDKYPGVKLGFSTQNFLAAMPVSVENLKEILDFASSEGFEFIELRDPLAKLIEEECKLLAEYASLKNIEVIYEMHMDFFSADFLGVFEKAVRNTAIFGEPGLLRSILSFTEFANDPNKKGWTPEELINITTLADSCAAVADKMDVQFVLENIIEPWSGDETVNGFEEFFANTSQVGLQFDTANPFLSACRGMADPEDVLKYLETIADRWYTTHLKCAAEDAFQPFLMDNPLPYGDVLKLMADFKVSYAALELLSVDNKEECFENHRKSLRYLADKGIIKPNQ